MPDIIIGRRSRYNRIIITADTKLGREWIMANFMFEGEGNNVYVSVDAEHKEDFIQKLQEEEIEFEDQGV